MEIDFRWKGLKPRPMENKKSGLMEACEQEQNISLSICKESTKGFCSMN